MRDVRIRFGDASEVLDLRHAVLRAGLARETAIFPGDDEPTSKHVVVTLNGRVVGCASVHLSSCDGAPAWQLRGMATDPAVRGAGIGRAMLEFVERSLHQSNTLQMWCNARVSAILFYEKFGWVVVSDAFDIPNAGPHVKMIKTLTAVSPAPPGPT